MRRLLPLAAVALICAAVSPALLTRSSAATTTKLAWITIGNNKFRNFDFTTTKGGSHHVDWPVDFIYFNNASISTIQSDLQALLPCQHESTQVSPCAAVMYMHYSTNSGSTYSWMKSASMKQSASACTPAKNLHQRIYGPGSGGRFYSTKWGYFVIGTTHFDYQEFCGGWSGQSETAEKTLCNQYWAPWTGDPCWYGSDLGGPDLHNKMSNQLVDHHWWRNNGRASLAYAP